MGELRGEALEFSRENDFLLGPVDVEVQQKGLCCIIGPNGGGKSTLLQILAGVLRPDKGKVLLEGRPVAQLQRRDVAVRVGYLPQVVRSLYAFRTDAVVAMGRFPVDGGHIGRASAREAAMAAMEKTGILHLKGRFLSDLSGGERQRVLLASVLCRNPDYLLLDEPTTGLDPHHGAEFFSLLQKETRSSSGALVVSHDINLAAAFADNLIFMDQGRILARGKPADVMNSEVLARAYGRSMAVWSHPDGRGGRVLLPERKDFL
ncbi:ABC transporter ATP-binding protein [Desulfobotulus mexicanus]|uniref:ABC transporter ATP-binding protein n=1 Tax=Desulfobotulus mexicanus TaxID=2586642 RepID=A0A5S5MCZ6_9BACT|nr:ABC transporter ATP-binding protein [Desulfobotulus mexicanus]TYT73505.1 ABC transporter ATP-binding protein [Desulfobotulus mexicanus]